MRTSFALLLSYILACFCTRISTAQTTDPIKFTLDTKASFIGLNEEIEIVIKAKKINLSPNMVFIFKDSYSFCLKMVFPSGFIITGGSYTDFITGNFSQGPSEIVYKVRGKFISAGTSNNFTLLRGAGSSKELSQFVAVASLEYGVRDDIPPGNKQESMKILAVTNRDFVPYMTMDDLRNGLHIDGMDTARVVQIIDEGKAGQFIYDSSDLTSVDDGAMIVQYADKRYKRIFSDGVNVRWFGAKGGYDLVSATGSDDRAAFQKAIDYIYEKGSYLLIPMDVYYLSAQVGRVDILATKKIRIVGQQATIIMTASNVEKKVFNFTAANTENFAISINENVKARSAVGNPTEISKLKLNSADFAKVRSGDVIKIDSYVHSSDPVIDDKLSSSEWSTITQINGSDEVFIPAPIMPIYATPKVVDSDYKILTTYNNVSTSSGSIQVYKQFELDISGINFVADFRNGGNKNLFGIYALQGVTTLDNCSYRAYPEDNIPGEGGGVEYGLNRVLIYLGNCRDAKITNCRLENYGYGIWLNRGYNAIIDNVYGKKGRHLVTSHGWTNVNISNLVCTTGGAFDAHGGASDWTLINVTANNSINPKNISEDLNNIRIQVGNIRMVNCKVSSPTIGKNTTDYWDAKFINSAPTGKYGYETRIKPSSFEAVNCHFRNVGNWGRYTNFTNCVIDRLSTQEQNLPLSSGTFGGLPSYVNLFNCRTSAGRPLGAASQQFGRNIIVTGNSPTGTAYYLIGSQLVTIGKSNSLTDSSEVTLQNNTIFIFVTPDATNIPDGEVDYVAMNGTGGKGLTMKFISRVSFEAIPANLAKFTLVFLLGNYGLPNSSSKARATIKLVANSTANGSLNVSQHLIADEVSFYISHNLNGTPLIYKNFQLAKATGTGTAFTLKGIRTHNHTTNSGNLTVGFPIDYLNGAMNTQAASLVRNGYEMDLTVEIPGSGSTISGLLIEGDISFNQ